MAPKWSPPRYPEWNADDLNNLLDFARHSHFEPDFTVLQRDNRTDSLTWNNDLEGGSEEIIAASVLSQLTHVSTLDLELRGGFVENGSNFFWMLKWMVEVSYRYMASHWNKKARSRSASLKPGWPYHINEKPLSQLKSVDLGPCYIDHGQVDVTVDLIQLFAALPSVRMIRAAKPGFWNMPARSAASLAMSKVSTLRLHSGLLPSEVILMILGEMPALESFSYASPTVRQVPFLAIQEGLLTHARHFLRSLSLPYGPTDGEVWKVGTWSQFPALVNLNLVSSALLPPSEAEKGGCTSAIDSPEIVNALREKLPPSLRRLGLFVNKRHPIDPIEDLDRINTIVMKKQDVFPNLERLAVYLDQVETRRSPRVSNATGSRKERFLASCQRKGIEASVSFTPWNCKLCPSWPGVSVPEGMRFRLQG